MNGSLVATVRLKMPATACKIYLSAKPGGASLYQSFILRDTLNGTGKATPDHLVLTPSAFSVHTNFLGEVAVTGALSYLNKSVSTGTLVVFEDQYTNGHPVGGRFRAVRDTTDATSTAHRHLIHRGRYPLGTQLFISNAFTWTLTADKLPFILTPALLYVIP